MKTSKGVGSSRKTSRRDKRKGRKRNKGKAKEKDKMETGKPVPMQVDEYEAAGWQARDQWQDDHWKTWDWAH